MFLDVVDVYGVNQAPSMTRTSRRSPCHAWASDSDRQPHEIGKRLQETSLHTVTDRSISRVQRRPALSQKLAERQFEHAAQLRSHRRLHRARNRGLKRSRLCRASTQPPSASSSADPIDKLESCKR